MLSTVNAQSSSNNQIAHNKSTAENASEIIMKNMELLPSAELYDNWDNKLCHPKMTVIPDFYKIDLRNFSMPIEQSFITSNFGKRWNRNHNGVDIKAYLGDTIYAAFSGKVRVVKYDPKGYGNVIVIRHYNGLETVYGHLSKQIVKVNDVVEAGQPIGLAGNTGRSTGTHLHFETRFCGIPINPLEIFSFKYRDITDDFYTWKKK
jgi:murein DD-endopeptidase MepM/ murein hydrolase activator NlpD